MSDEPIERSDVDWKAVSINAFHQGRREAAERKAAERKIAAVEALLDDPWHGDAQWGALHPTGVSRRGNLRGGYFVAVDDLRAALRGDA